MRHGILCSPGMPMMCIRHSTAMMSQRTALCTNDCHQHPHGIFDAFGCPSLHQCLFALSRSIPLHMVSFLSALLLAALLLLCNPADAVFEPGQEQVWTADISIRWQMQHIEPAVALHTISAICCRALPRFAEAMCHQMPRHFLRYDGHTVWQVLWSRSRRVCRWAWLALQLALQARICIISSINCSQAAATHAL